MNKNKKIITGIGAVVVVVALFYAGVVYGKAHAAPTSSARGQFAAGRGSAGARNANGGAVVGSVISKDDNSITVSTQGGGSRIIITSSATQVMKSTSGSLGDVGVGDMIVAQGTANSDGSVTAQTVQIRPTASASAQK